MGVGGELAGSVFPEEPFRCTVPIIVLTAFTISRVTSIYVVWLSHLMRSLWESGSVLALNNSTRVYLMTPFLISNQIGSEWKVKRCQVFAVVVYIKMECIDVRRSGSRSAHGRLHSVYVIAFCGTIDVILINICSL